MRNKSLICADLYILRCIAGSLDFSSCLELVPAHGLEYDYSSAANSKHFY